MRSTLFLAAIALAAGAADLAAQTTATVNTTLSYTMQERLFIDVDDDNLMLPDPSTSDLDAGFTQSVAHDVEHRGNVDHTITVAPAAATWNAPLSYTGTKPAGDLEWSSDGGTSWNPVDAAATVGTGVRGGFGLNPDIPVSWRAAVGYDEPAGGYNLTVTYTSTAN